MLGLILNFENETFLMQLVKWLCRMTEELCKNYFSF